MQVMEKRIFDGRVLDLWARASESLGGGGGADGDGGTNGTGKVREFTPRGAERGGGWA